MTKVFVEDTELKDIADAIREKNGTEGTYKPSEMGSAVRAIEGDCSVDIERSAKNIALAGLGLFDDTAVTLNLDSATTLSNLIALPANKNTSVEHLIVNCPNQVTNCYMMFYLSTPSPDDVLKRITLNVDTSKVNRFGSTFAYCMALEVVDGSPFDFSSATEITSFFAGSAVSYFRVVPNTIAVNCNFSGSSRLSDETIQSIIDGLVDLTDGTARTITFHATVLAKLTDEQLEQVSNKNWTLG